MNELPTPIKETMEVTRWVEPQDSRISINSVEFFDSDRVYIAVNELFDVRIIRTDEGIVIDVYPFDELAAGDEPVATTYAYDSEVMPDPT